MNRHISPLKPSSCVGRVKSICLVVAIVQSRTGFECDSLAQFWNSVQEAFDTIYRRPSFGKTRNRVDGMLRRMLSPAISTRHGGLVAGVIQPVSLDRRF
jgi:hypothetical protein